MHEHILALLALSLPFALAAACSGENTTGASSTAVDSGTNGSSGSSTSGGGSSTSSTSGSSSGQGGSTSSSSGGSSGDSGAGDAADSSSEAAAEAGAPCNTDPHMALQFEGQTPDLVQANIAKLPIGRASRTIELWAWFDGSSGSWVNEHGLFETGDRYAGPPGGCHEFGVNSTAWGPGQTLAMLHPYGNCNSVDNFFNLPSDTFPTNSRSGWVHVSFAYDMQANNFQFTINGDSMLDIGTGAGAAGRTHPETDWPADPSWGTTAYPSGNVLSIGTTPQFKGPTGWQGKIDELRVWSVFRPAADIKATMKVMLRGNEPGLVAYYKFDEGTGTTIADATGDATNVATMIPTPGSPTTSPKWVISDIPGPFTCP